MVDFGPRSWATGVTSARRTSATGCRNMHKMCMCVDDKKMSICVDDKIGIREGAGVGRSQGGGGVTSAWRCLVCLSESGSHKR